MHSGSRGLGAAIAAHHARAASGEADGLASLDVREAAGAAYLADLGWALAFARANRRRLVERALDVLAATLGPFASSEVADVHHNFVQREAWRGRDLLVHRKGAVAVPRGSLALVPGSKRRSGSCSHGAGRVMSRREARSRVSPAQLERAMRRVVFPSSMTRGLVEEAPAAYRDVREVLEDQEDLVVRRLRLAPIAVLKGA